MKLAEADVACALRSDALKAIRLTPLRASVTSASPRRHLDPGGALMIAIAGFGWGKPTPVNPNYLRHGPKMGRAIVSAGSRCFE